MMTKAAVGKIIREGFRGELREEEPLIHHVSMRTGGPAALFAVPDNVQDIITLLNCLEEEGIPWILLGGGTNTVFANGGYRGCVLHLGKGFAYIQNEENFILKTGAAVSLPEVVKRTAEDSLSGMECLLGIPGTVGGAVFMNAGTRDGEIADTIHEIQIFNGKDASWIPRDQIAFSYRSSSIPEGHIILGARFKLKPSARKEIRSKMKEQAEQRLRTQPSGVHSAGCWFRNPKGESAGRLIEEVGMKGERFGRAQVSESHANFIVNLGGAQTSDFINLAEKVRDAVYNRFGIVLQEEVRIIDG